MNGTLTLCTLTAFTLSVTLAGTLSATQAPRFTPPQSAVTRDTDVGALFSENALFEFVLETDLRSLTRDVGEERAYHPATISYVAAEGDRVSVRLDLRTRGEYRRKREHCSFPPLRLTLPKDGTAHTLFAGQAQLKLVTHCRESDRYEQYLLQEYLLYRLYNLFTEWSFRVRLVRITYVDIRGREDSITRHAFLIEDEDAMARRNECRAVDVQAPPLDYSSVPSVRHALFQYMIGNTDWSVRAQHNVKSLVCPGYYGIPVPYDFDFSGIIATRYAVPNPRLNLPSVRVRMFRGYCRPEDDFEQVRQEFIAQRDEVYALYRRQQGLDEKNLERALEYMEDFYHTMEDSKRFARQILRECRR